MIVLRMAQYLSHRSIPFCVVEPSGTRLFNDLGKIDIVSPEKINIYKKVIKYVFVPNVAKFRDPLFPWALREAKIFAWIVHPNEPFRSFFPFSGKLLDIIGYKGVGWLKQAMPRHLETVTEMFSILLEKRGLAAMDAACDRALQYFYPDLAGSASIIPIPTETCAEYVGERVKEPGISVGYLGRMDSFKYSAIAPFIRYQLEQISRSERVFLHAISEGKYMPELRSLCEKSNIVLREYGFKSNEIAKSIIKNRTDFAIAMGTAALDIAGAGHPCMIIDPALSRSTPPQSTFRFVHEIQDYVLGEYRDFPGYNPGLRSFEKNLAFLSDSDLGRAELSYVIRSHATETTFDMVKSGLSSSQIRVGDLEPAMFRVESSFQSIRRWWVMPAL